MLEIDTTDVATWEAVYCDGANSVDDIDAGDQKLCIGVCVGAGKVLTHGIIYNSDFTCSAGSIAYVGDNGALRTTPPDTSGDWVQVVGAGIGNGIMIVNPSFDWVEVV